MKELNDPKDVCVNVHRIPITENRMNYLSINFVCVFFCVNLFHLKERQWERENALNLLQIEAHKCAIYIKYLHILQNKISVTKNTHTYRPIYVGRREWENDSKCDKNGGKKNVFKTEWTPIAMHQTDGTIN